MLALLLARTQLPATATGKISAHSSAVQTSSGALVPIRNDTTPANSPANTDTTSTVVSTDVPAGNRGLANSPTTKATPSRTINVMKMMIPLPVVG